MIRTDQIACDRFLGVTLEAGVLCTRGSGRTFYALTPAPMCLGGGFLFWKGGEPIIYEDILPCAEKVEGIGKFLKNLDPGDLSNSGEVFFLDAGQVLIEAAEEIIQHCAELKPIELAKSGKEIEA